MLSDFRLSRIQLQEAADAAVAIGLELGDFEWTVHEKPTRDHHNESFILKTHKVTHRPTSAWFHFRLSHGVVEWWPIINAAQGRDAMAKTWPEQLAFMKTWLAVVKAEHETPDLSPPSYGRESCI